MIARLRSHLGVLFLVLSIPSGVTAQKPTPDARVQAESARSSMRRYVACSVESDVFFHAGRGVFAMLGEAGDAMKSSGKAVLFDSSCLDHNNYEGRWVAELGFGSTLARGQIFRALYLQGWGIRKRKDLHGQFQVLVRRPLPDNVLPLVQFGECVSTLNSEGVVAALKAPVGTKQEDDAFSALRPAFADCVAPGSTIRFSKAVVEGALAEALFRRSFDAEPANGLAVGSPASTASATGVRVGATQRLPGINIP